MIWLVAICIALAFTASLLLVPLLRTLAHSVGLVDHPDNDRKLHSKPVALGGGLAIYLVLVAAFAATIVLSLAAFRLW